MAEYRVTWTIDIVAESPREAAQQAQAIQRDADSIATVFEVIEHCTQCGTDAAHFHQNDMVEIDLMEAEDGIARQ